MTKKKKPLNRSQIMARVKSKDTSIEIILRKALWSRGLRYRKNVRTIIGTPDIAFPNLKIAVFCDSEFWHGKDFLQNKNLPKNNRQYWKTKLERNIERDKKVTSYLLKQGWSVLRFWEKDILIHVEKIADQIEALVKKRQQNKLLS